MTEEEIINAVRWRYRICHYLFRLGAIWMLTGAVAGLFAIRYQWWVVELIGLSHGYIKNDFDVSKWAAPEFLEQAGRELLEEEWKKKTTSKLPQTAGPLASAGPLG